MSVVTLKLPRRYHWVYYLFLVTLLALTVYHTVQLVRHQPQHAKPIPSKVIDSTGDVIYYPKHEVQ